MRRARGAPSAWTSAGRHLEGRWPRLRLCGAATSVRLAWSSSQVLVLVPGGQEPRFVFPAPELIRNAASPTLCSRGSASEVSRHKAAPPPQSSARPCSRRWLRIPRAAGARTLEVGPGVGSAPTSLQGPPPIDLVGGPSASGAPGSHWETWRPEGRGGAWGWMGLSLFRLRRDARCQPRPLLRGTRSETGGGSPEREGSDASGGGSGH